MMIFVRNVREIMKNDDETRQQDWIGCDVCPKWFHYQCVGLDSIPDDTWLCPYCAD